jgi:hypothetical protein
MGRQNTVKDSQKTVKDSQKAVSANWDPTGSEKAVLGSHRPFPGQPATTSSQRQL